MVDSELDHRASWLESLRWALVHVASRDDSEFACERKDNCNKVVCDHEGYRDTKGMDRGKAWG